MKTTRTRFAPSPTGYIHVGNVRSALYPYLIARQAKNSGDQNARFVLRIEDTDQSRFVESAEDLIIETLKWLGLDWDEGPLAASEEAQKLYSAGESSVNKNNDKEAGAFGPYHQTSRTETYNSYAEKIVAAGFGYADLSDQAGVQAFREKCQADKKPFTFRAFRELHPEIMGEWKPNCEKPLRFKVRDLKSYSWHDEVFGDLTAGAEVLDDFILMKSDGLPTYNFAHVVDDNEMQITHVIRGQEYISSMPKYLSLYDALGIKWPVFAHLPHILKPDGKKKLGKRDGAKSVSEYREDGILPEAMVNFLALLGWNPGGGSEQEIFTLEDLTEQFSLDHVQKSGARFDEKRLIWLNGAWIRKIAEEDFAKLIEQSENFWGKNAQKSTPEFREKVLKIVAERLKTLRDLPALSEYFFAHPEPNWSLINENKQLKKLETSELENLLQKAHEKLSALSDTDFANPEKIQQTLNDLLEETGQKPGILFSLIRFSLTWAPFSPGLPETFATLGKAESLARIKAAIETEK